MVAIIPTVMVCVAFGFVVIVTWEGSGVGDRPARLALSSPQLPT